MLRTAFGTFEALIERSAFARTAAGRQFWAQRIARINPGFLQQQRARISQLRLPTSTPRANAGRQQFKTSSFSTPRRNFHSSRARRDGDKGHRSNGDKPNSGKAEPESSSLSQRLKKLSREYGWTAVGIYFSMSVLDFPFCFLLVRIVGTEKIAYLEEIVVDNAKKVIPQRVQDFWHEYRNSYKKAKEERTGQPEAEVIGHGVAEAEAANKQGASLATQLALAYAIHKSFIFIRVPLTAAVTPKIVKVLRGWGWQIGKRPVRPAKAAGTGAKVSKAPKKSDD
ncbi:hypothetical protein QBC35DRAFT_24390 [Podospora australis]|uniref:DUF1279 domain-containing protein n=1 Tax=Podospora australis TaxID=1536484 RepID=A0AAN6WZQ7_9PEZI|nr:hypothetical protein QBC35DRAFT_24390 [Podospora australis]